MMGVASGCGVRGEAAASSFACPVREPKRAQALSRRDGGVWRKGDDGGFAEAGRPSSVISQLSGARRSSSDDGAGVLSEPQPERALPELLPAESVFSVSCV